MGQKVHPIGFRLGVNKTWNSQWHNAIFSNYNGYTHLLKEDFNIYDYMRGTLRTSNITTHLSQIFRKSGSIYLLLNINYIKNKRKKKRKKFRFRFKSHFHFKFKQKFKKNFNFLKKKRKTPLSKSLNFPLKLSGNPIKKKILLKKNIISKWKNRRLTRLNKFKNFNFIKTLKTSILFKQLKKFKKIFKKFKLKLKTLKQLKKFKLKLKNLRNVNALKVKYKIYLLKLKKFDKLNRLNHKLHPLKKKLRFLKKKLNKLKNKLKPLKKKILINQFQPLKKKWESLNLLSKTLESLKKKLNLLKKKLNKLKLKIKHPNKLLKKFLLKLKKFKYIFKKLNNFNKYHILLNLLKLNKLKRLKLKLYKLKKKFKILKKLKGFKGFKKTLKKLKIFKKLNKLRDIFKKLQFKIFELHLKTPKDLNVSSVVPKEFIWIKNKLNLLKNSQDSLLSLQMNHCSHIKIKKLKDHIHKKNLSNLKKFHKQKKKILLKKKYVPFTKKLILFEKIKRIKPQFLKINNFHKELVKIKSNLKWITKSKIKIFLRTHRKKFNTPYNLSYISKHLSNTLSQPKNKKRFVHLFYKLYRTLKKITLKLNKRKNQTKRIKGFRMKYAGKLWSKGRSKKRMVYHGPVPLHNLNEIIDYNFIRVITKYGVTGLKIWLNYFPRKSHGKILKKDLRFHKPIKSFFHHKKKLYNLRMLLSYYKDKLKKKIINKKDQNLWNKNFYFLQNDYLKLKYFHKKFKDKKKKKLQYKKRKTKNKKFNKLKFFYKNKK